MAKIEGIRQVAVEYGNVIGQIFVVAAAEAFATRANEDKPREDRYGDRI